MVYDSMWHIIIVVRQYVAYNNNCIYYGVRQYVIVYNMVYDMWHSYGQKATRMQYPCLS